MQPKKQNKGRKSKSKDERPARKRYWARRRLERNKVRNLVKCCKMKVQEAIEYWRSQRQTRIPARFNE